MNISGINFAQQSVYLKQNKPKEKTQAQSLNVAKTMPHLSAGVLKAYQVGKTSPAFGYKEEDIDKAVDAVSAEIKYRNSLILMEEYHEKRNLSGVNLNNANLYGINFLFCDLRKADLRKANLSGANLNGTKMQGADLRGSILCGTSFNKANLAGSNLKNTGLDSVDLTNANLKGTNLNGAKIRLSVIKPKTSATKGNELMVDEKSRDFEIRKELSTTLAGALYDSKTKLPDRYTYIEQDIEFKNGSFFYPVKKTEQREFNRDVAEKVFGMEFSEKLIDTQGRTVNRKKLS